MIEDAGEKDQKSTTDGRAVTIRLPSWSHVRARLGNVGIDRLGRGRWRNALVVLVVLLAASDLILHLQKDAIDDEVAARAMAVKSAEARVPAMLSYNYRTLDTDLAIASGNATGKFREDFTKVLSDVVAPNAQKKKITTRANITAASVQGGDADSVDVLLFLTQTTLTGSEKNPDISGSRVTVRMKKTNEGWFVASLDPV